MTPLIVRRHDVRAEVHRDIAVTDVEQVFFNPRSESLAGVYTVRLPRGAIVAGFEVRNEEDDSLLARTGLAGCSVRVVPPSLNGEGAPGIELQWAGPDRYRVAIADLAPGKTRVVRVRYVEWLARRDARRTWVYPMGGKAPPLLGEFSLEVETADAGAAALEAGMGARVEGGKVVLRRSDFRPHADFALDLLDGKEHPARRPAYRVFSNEGPRDGARGYLLVPVELPFGKPPAQVDLVLVADVSAATDPGRLDLERAVVDAILRQLAPGDRVALLAASTGTKSLGGGDALAASTPKRAEELLDALAHEAPAGATDLGRALEQAAAVAGEQGVVVYIGDGAPTVGALMAGEIRGRLARLGHPPRLFAVGVGSGARMDLLGELAAGGGITLRVLDRPEAAHAAYRVLAAASQPVLRELRFDFGPGVDVAYPTGPLHASAGEPVRIVGRLRGEAPKKLRVTGVRGSESFALDIPLVAQAVEDGGDVRRRWASGRLDDLLARSAGREAIVEVGTRFGLITPLTALATGSAATYTRIDFADFGEGGQDEGASAFVPPALRDQPPDDAPIALEAGTTSSPAARGSLEALYARAISGHDEAVRACYDRKAAGHPELSGRVEFAVRIGLGGEVQVARLLASSLRDSQVEACMTRAITSMRLPASPDGRVHELTRAWQFEQADGRLGAPSRCSTASRQYLATRRALWRERLAGLAGVEGAMNVWRGAERACELRTWLDRRALLDLLRPHAGRVYHQVDLYHRFEGASDVQAHLRREILRAVRTPEDVRAIRGGLALDGGISADLLEEQLKKAPDAAARVKVLRLFLALAPDGVALRVRLLQALEEAAVAGRGGGALDEARRVAWALRGEPAADLAARQAVGEFFARQKDLPEAARAFSEIVEFAPFDPWARRRLGDLYLAYGRYDDAYREYATLAWLTPTDGSVLLLLARAAAAAGRTDEALRLEERLAESVEARGARGDAPGWARAFISLQLADLRDGARKSSDADLTARLAARARADGILGVAGKALAAVTWPHPDARLELWITAPGDKEARRAEVRGGTAGVESLRLKELAPGAYTLGVRRPAHPATDRVRVDEADLWLLLDEGQPSERLAKLPVRLTPADGEATFTLDARGITPARVLPAIPSNSPPPRTARSRRPR